MGFKFFDDVEDVVWLEADLTLVRQQVDDTLVATVDMLRALELL